jgi:ferredoxin-NADP reductase
MSDVRIAVLREAQDYACSRWLQLELCDGRPLPFRGGQYVIVDTGLKLSDGRARKRAYSMLSADTDPTRFELGVFRLPSGEAAEYLNTLPLGGEIRFTGPWGKLHVPQDLAERPGPIWVIATDSGASGALGLLRSAALAPLLPRVQCWHFRTHTDAFLSDAFLHERFPQLHSEPLASVQAPLRATELEHWLAQQLQRELPAQVYVIGDGALARLATSQLMAAGLREEQVQSESFFNHEKKAKAEPAAP